MLIDILGLVAIIWVIGAIAVWLAALAIYVIDGWSPDTARPLLHSAPVWPLVLIKLTIDVARKEDQ